MRYEKPKFRPMGDRSLLVELGDEISPAINQSVQELFVGLDLQKPNGILELVPGYRSLLVMPRSKELILVVVYIHQRSFPGGPVYLLDGTGKNPGVEPPE